MRLNILHVDTEKSWRGGERQAYFLIKYLPADSFTSFVATPKDKPFYTHLADLTCTRIPFSMFGEWDIVAAWRLSRIIKHNSIDIVHAHTSHALGIGALSRLFTCFKLIGSRRVDYPLAKHFLSRLKYKTADRIVAISYAIKNILIDHGIDPDRISVVHSGVELLDTPTVDTKVMKKTLGIPLDHTVIGNIGALTDQKDHDTFIAAADKILQIKPNTIFLIIGGGARQKELEKHIHALQRENQIRLLGFRDDLQDLIGIMDLYVVSSCFEGMGTSTLDVMYQAKPVVATNVGGIPEIVEDGKTGYLVDVRNYQGIADRVIELLNNREKDRSMGLNGKEKSKQFTAQNMARGISQVYRNICKGDGL